MKIVTVIQARMSSTRLPGKILKPIMGKSLLYRMVERVRGSQLAGTVVVAITTDPEDDVLETLCHAEGILCFRGHPTDLLDRHFQAGKLFKADAVVKIPSDCPLIDPAVIDRVLGVFIKTGRYDFVSNLHPATYPDGNDVEVMKMSALEKARKEAKRGFEREHTTPYFWDYPGKFKTANVVWEIDKDFSMSHRWTIDYPEDYRFIRTVYDALYNSDRPNFTLDDILHLLETKPWIAELNKHFAGVNWYRHHLHELHTISPDRTRHAEHNSQSGVRAPSITEEGTR